MVIALYLVPVVKGRGETDVLSLHPPSLKLERSQLITDVNWTMKFGLLLLLG